VVEGTTHGFFELIVRVLLETLDRNEGGALGLLREQHQRITNAGSGFQASLAFNTAIAEACARLSQPIILLIDEFDEIYNVLDDRALLNLRALKDKYRERLNFLTASIRPLTDTLVRAENEFAELFASRLVPMSQLSPADSSGLVESIAGQGLAPALKAEILALGGGHYGLLIALSQAALRGGNGIAQDPNARAECLKIWNQLRPAEQTALRELASDSSDGIGPAQRPQLEAFGLVDGEGQIFSPLFKTFLLRQQGIHEDELEGIAVDEDAGEVRVNGTKVEVLTDLEYRLMRLLFERSNRLTTKDLIVDQVWGGQYLDKVDDARIEKLVSRLRAKIEPDPLKPRYVLTQRGRGYKLVSKPSDDVDLP
jgi:DNA-binding winged helix-turn-helix (wHTH) protein